MATNHEFKIILNERTRVVLEEAQMIPMNVFSFKNSEKIVSTGRDSPTILLVRFAFKLSKLAIYILDVVA